MASEKQGRASSGHFTEEKSSVLGSRAQAQLNALGSLKNKLTKGVERAQPELEPKPAADSKDESIPEIERAHHQFRLITRKQIGSAAQAQQPAYRTSAPSEIRTTSKKHISSAKLTSSELSISSEIVTSPETFPALKTVTSSEIKTVTPSETLTSTSTGAITFPDTVTYPHTVTSPDSLSSSNSAKTFTSSATLISPDTFDSPDTLNLPISATSKSAKVAHAYREVRHFVGGLIEHPSESTKHFTILRHSHGLVYYQGINTSIAVSIFADVPLPESRALWLQSKGWTGKTGWQAKKLFGRNADWIEVTPSTPITPEQMNPYDERAWQRDIDHFFRKGPDGYSRNHQIKETAIVRIPVEAQDGYFRILLCDEKKNTLCPSPVFRVASASTSPSSTRGASLGTIPLEIGANAMSSMMTGYVGGVLEPITSAIQNQFGAFQPAIDVGTTAYDINETQKSIQEICGAYDEARGSSYDALDESSLQDIPLAQTTFPLFFKSKVIRSTGDSTKKLSMPTANLQSIPDHIAHQLSGYYYGWACVTNRSEKEQRGSEAQKQWYHAIISVLPKAEKRASVAVGARKSASAHLIHDFEGKSFTGATLEISIMGFLRPATEHQADRNIDEKAAFAAASDDVALAEALLTRLRCDPTGKPMTGDIMEVGDTVNPASPRFSIGASKVTEKYVKARLSAQQQVDRVALHRAGVRTQVDKLREKSIGTGGLYITR